MKISAVLLLVLLTLSGCATGGRIGGLSPNLVNGILDANLPAEYTGDARFRHRNPYATINIRAGNLRRGPAGWNFDWLIYTREGRVSDGTIVLGKPPLEAFSLQ